MEIKDSTEYVKLTNEELVKEISSTNDTQLSKIGTMAYVELFNRTLYLRTIIREDKGLIEDIVEEESEFKKLYDNFMKEIIDLKPVISLTSENSLDVEEYKNIRKDIVKLLRCLSAYNTEISYAHEIAKDLAYREFLKENASDMEKKIDYEKLIKNIQMFLSEDAKSIKDKVKDITSVLPVRVAKHKYYDMIANALNRSLKEASPEMIDTILNRYKTLFDGTREAEYGLYFDRYFRKAQEARNFDFKSSDEKELNDFYNDTLDTIDEINKVSNIIREFGIIVNRLIAISLLKDNIADNLKNPEIKALLTDWNNYLDNPKTNQARVMNQYKKVFKELDKKFQETNDKLQRLTMENFNRKNKIDENLKTLLQRTQYVLSYINDYALEHEEIKEVEYYEPAGTEYVEESVSNFVDFLDRTSKDLINLQRKTRMKRLLSLVDGVFPSPQDFFEYLANSINLTTKEEESVALANSILEVMNFYRDNNEKLN